VGASLARRIRASPDRYLRAPALIGAELRGVTNRGANFVELFFCQLRCNARCDRPHKYPLLVNLWT
jgi:hypothetical protein